MANKRISQLTNTITAFRTGDYIPVDGPSGTAKMSKDALLQVAAENALAGNVAQAFDPARTSDDPYNVGEAVVYDGRVYRFTQAHYGPWSSYHVSGTSYSFDDYIQLYIKSILDAGFVWQDKSYTFQFQNNTLLKIPLDVVIGYGCDVTVSVSGPFNGSLIIAYMPQGIDPSGNPYINFVSNLKAGQSRKITANFITQNLGIWMSGSTAGIGEDYTISFTIRPGVAFADVKKLEELNTMTGRSSSTTSKTHTYQSNILLTYEGFDIGPGNILRVTQSGEYSGRIHVGYFDESGTRHDSVIVVNGQGFGEYEMPEVSHKLVVWLAGSSSNVGKDVVMTFEVISNVTGEVINEIKRKVDSEFIQNKFKNFSIIGDSYSTYYGWIPSENSTWYAVDGIDGNNSQTNDVNAVEDTWWHKLSKALKIGLIRNESWSGSSISYTNYGSVQKLKSFVGRAEHLDQNNVLLSKPGLIIIMGGTNDAWSSAVCGDPMYSGWTDGDLEKFAPALCKLINDLIKWNPQATILNVVNTGFPADYNSAIETIAEHYGILNLFLSFSSSDKQNGHPNKSGMTKICNQIIAKLNAS